MKANEFVKENPWLLDDDMKELKEIITDARDYKFFCLNNFLGHSYDNHGGGVAFSIADLKRLAESHELVEKLGGLDKAKKVAKNAFDSCSKIISDRSVGLECTYMNLMNAIADVEACQ